LIGAAASSFSRRSWRRSAPVLKEIQNERDPFFDERLFIYHYRIFDKTRDPVITLALLTDLARQKTLT
jgi:hypothetical protein